MKPDLDGLVTRYQELLRLRDWRIEVAYKPGLSTRDGRPVWGLCYPTVDARVARIEIRDPSTPPAGVSLEDATAQVVETVVHELVHLHFAAFGNTSPAEIAAEEQAVWALAGALVSAHGTTREAPIARAMLAGVARARVVEGQPLNAANLARLRGLLGFSATTTEREIRAAVALGLSFRELAMCAEMKLEPRKYADAKARRHTPQSNRKQAS
jgi:hypothetical protein